ncbi:MAG: STAS domain-containing protein [Lachnospiraceae bacterium]|nr:STAS domain-containing protein [Lachnospiraceae bacterium]
MTINKIFEDTSLTAEIEGRIDTQTAPELEKELKAVIDDVTDLVLDFTKVNYISSAGLRTIITAQNWMEAKDGTMVIRGADKNIKNIFKVTGFDTFLTLE